MASSPDANPPPAFRFSTHGEGELPADAVQVVDDGIGRFNAAAAPLHEVQALGCFVRDAADAVLGGAVGRTWGACFELQQLWVHDGRRGQGLGRALLQRFEAAAAARGCTRGYLVTWSFQAPAFYARHGWREVHRIEGYGHGLVWFHMERRLDGIRHTGPA